jgi:hypothetical protein
MKGNPHWMELCQQASVEQDHENLMELINEINGPLNDKKRQRATTATCALRSAPPKTEDAR